MRPCKTCHLPVGIYRHGRECSTCSKYRLRNGTARPQRLIDAAAARLASGWTQTRKHRLGFSVYLFYDDAGAVLYVGSTGQGSRRFAQHALTRPWWDRVATARIHHVESREDALAMEQGLIRTLRPPFNAQ